MQLLLLAVWWRLMTRHHIELGKYETRGVSPVPLCSALTLKAELVSGTKRATAFCLCRWQYAKAYSLAIFPFNVGNVYLSYAR